MRLKCILLLAFCASLHACAKRSYFDTAFLARPDAVKSQLIEQEGFVEGYFSAADGVALNYLWLKRPEARCTVICCSGFWPGRKEGIATLYELLSDDCNILLFDARGHGASEGTLWRTLLQYGVCEYNDVIGAVQWAHEQLQQPIILFGVCAGAFHATHAVAHMHKQNMLEQYNVKGVIFDSGWNSLMSIVPTAFSGELKKRIYTLIKRRNLFIQQGVRYGITVPLSYLIHGTVPMLSRCFVSKKARNATLQKKIGCLDIPVLYIHSEDDSFARIDPVRRLAKKTRHAYTWWISQPSTHACHHLKYPDFYREQLEQFIATALQ